MGRAQAGAWRKGYAAALEGKPKSACPYNRFATAGYSKGRRGPTFERGFASAWRDGWEVGKTEVNKGGKK